MDPFEEYKYVRRCPVCLSRDIDVLLLSEPETPRDYYCPKCSFHGGESEVFAMYRDIQKKYAWMTWRLTVEEQNAL